MTPYFERGGIALYLGDCRDVLPTLAAESVDLLLTDPPYGVRWRNTSQRTSGNFAPIVGDDGTLDVPDALIHAVRALREGRHAYVFGRFDLSTLRLASATELIWDKGQMGPGDLSLPWGPAHEPIMFAVKVASAANRERGSGRLAARLRRGSVVRHNRLNSGGVARHPTEKPVMLLRQLVESSSLIGETVLDPFAGSGSTLEAARIEGRSAIGIEIDERYCEIAAKRLSQTALPMAVAD